MTALPTRSAEAAAFAGYRPRERRVLARLATVIDVPAGRVLTREGDPGREFALILAGTAEVTRNGQSVAALGAGDQFGEISLLDGVARTATVRAATPMVLAVVGAGDFAELLAQVPSLARRVHADAAHRREQLDRVA